MKKVLLVATVQSHIAQFHNSLIKMLKENGYHVDIAAKDNLNEKNGLSINNADKIYNINFSRSPFNFINIKAYKDLKKIILNNEYDIIHCNTPMGGILTRLVKKNNKKVKSKIIYTAHGFHFFNGAPLLNWMIYYPIEKFFSKYTDVLITINEEDYQLAKKKFKCTNIQKINGTGINLAKFKHSFSTNEKQALKQELNIKKGDIVLVNIGELNKNKNQIMQLKAIKKLVKEGFDNIKLFICGNGPLKQKYIKYINRNSLNSNVFLLGYRNDINKILKLANCVVSTSIREGLGINILEAMASQVPVIATKNRGHKELIENGKNGYLIDINNINALKENIKKIIRSNNEDIKKNETIKVHNYSQENVNVVLEKIYNSLGESNE